MLALAAVRRVWIIACVITLSGLCAQGAQPAAQARPEPKTFIFHLNGIGGRRAVDHWLMQGLKEGGLDFDFEYYDWTHGEEGMVALQAYKQNHEEARTIAKLIEKEYRARPHQRFILTAHSGGAGLAVWALEDLPADVKVDTFIMFAPALSPEYDLSKALGHVKGNCYVFSSTMDKIVLGLGTRLFGTIDGIKCEAAGYGGFVMPSKADQKQYQKLVPQPYQDAWLLAFGNAGSHICSMRPKFVSEYVAPIILTGKPPLLEAARKPATRPAVAAQAKAMP